LIQKLNGKIEVLCGADEVFLSAVIAGSNAAIMASANVIPHIWLKIMKLARENKLEEAAKLQREAQTFARMVLKYGAAPPIKAALRMNTGGTLTPEVKDDIRLELEKLDVIEKHKHEPIQKDIQILEVLENQGITLGHSAGLLTSNASNETVSVGIVAGPKTGSIGHAFVKLLTMAKTGHEALTIILEPNLPVKPSSLMLPTRRITSMRQASLFYGPVQSGAAKAVASLLASGKVPEKALNEDIAIMALDIDLESRDRREVVNATQQAVETALAGIWR